jgi:hypothetical protein
VWQVQVADKDGVGVTQRQHGNAGTRPRTHPRNRLESRVGGFERHANGLFQAPGHDSRALEHIRSAALDAEAVEDLIGQSSDALGRRRRP